MILKTSSLTPALAQIILHKATEYPFSGEYTDNDQPGTYLCRHCGLALFRATTKFHSGCGWPSFDAAIHGAVTQCPDQDGSRTEILCARCAAHLGHVFNGEGFTAQNIRHCVNSASLDFVEHLTVQDSEEAIFAAGCFWGVEYYFQKLTGVVKTQVGYSGGELSNPSYEAVCAQKSGHLEVIRVLYDPSQIDYKALTQYFFEIHDPTQANGQGPDLGPQYLSTIFYYNAAQKTTAALLINQLRQQGLAVQTKCLPVQIFWPAEAYHQCYYAKAGKQPYCHHYIKRFD